MAELDREKVLDNVMLDLEISKDDDDSIDLLRVLLNRVISHFKAEYAVVNIDDGFSFIFEDCVIKRFNRRGAEGAKAETVDGHSMSYYDNENEFKPYDDMLQRRERAVSMRYTDTVILKYQNDKTPKRYDPTLGRMVGGEDWCKEVKCNVTGASLDLQAKLGGLLNATSLVIRFRSPVTVSVTSVEYRGSKYIPVTARGYLAGRSVLYVNKAVK